MKTPVRQGYRFRDKNGLVGCVLTVGRGTSRAVVAWEQPGGEKPLAVLKIERILAGRRLAPDTLRMDRMPCLCCGRGRQMTVRAAARLAKRLGVKPDLVALHQDPGHAEICTALAGPPQEGFVWCMYVLPNKRVLMEESIEGTTTAAEINARGGEA